MLLLRLLLLSFVSLTYSNKTSSYHDYCVVGAGPGGLQYSYFLHQAGRDYITFEKGPTAGTFYTKFPIHRYLISINKRNTGRTNKEFNFRHDWNSLVSHDEDLQITKYTKEFFPAADTLVQYLKDFARKLNINVQYNTTISNVKPRNSVDNLFHVDDQNGNEYTCKTIVIATGIAKPKHIEFKGNEYVTHYEDLTMDKEPFEAHSVLILGKGNSAFETAQHLLSHTNSIHFMSRSRVKLAWETHYVGDIRAVNNGPLDTYQLKSLDGAFDGDVSTLEIVKSEIDGRLYSVDGNVTSGPFGTETPSEDNDALREGYDSIISCIGFQFDNSIFANNVTVDPAGKGKKKKYPRITYQYESSRIKGLYFAGTNTHSLDHPKSAGGFIHGFRYTARTLHRILENKIEGNPWPSVTFSSPIDAIPHLLKRINEASDIYQMFSVLCEVMLFDKDGSVTYLEAYPCALTSRLTKISGHDVSSKSVLVAALEYGKNFSGPGSDPFRDGRATGEAADGHNANFLHPVLYFYNSPPTDEKVLTRPKKWILPIPDRLHHIVEDFTTVFNAANFHFSPLRRFFEKCLGKDFRQYLADQCMLSALTYFSNPESCQIFDISQGKGLTTSDEGTKTLKNMNPTLLHKFQSSY